MESDFVCYSSSKLTLGKEKGYRQNGSDFVLLVLSPVQI